MSQEIDIRISKLKEDIDELREFVMGINNTIENEGFAPSEYQQMTIDYICQVGQSTLKEINKLEKLKIVK